MVLVYSEHKNIEEGVFITKWSWAPLIHCTKMPLLLGKTMQCTPKNKQLGINCKQLFFIRPVHCHFELTGQIVIVFTVAEGVEEEMMEVMCGD